MASEVVVLRPPCLLRHHYADWRVDALMWASALSCPHVAGGCVLCVCVCETRSSTEDWGSHWGGEGGTRPTTSLLLRKM